MFGQRIGLHIEVGQIVAFANFATASRDRGTHHVQMSVLYPSLEVHQGVAWDI
jgi:hypothetical protein